MTTPARADIASLFAPAAGSEAFRQGVILAFDTATGTNQVQVGGAVLSNLPILVGGDTVNFAPGDAVILLKFRSSWAILGRIVVPGSDNLTAAAVAFFADGGYSGDPGGLGLGFNITTTWQTHTLMTVPVPTWANSALVSAQSWVLAFNTSGASTLLKCRTQVNGAGFANEVWFEVASGAGFYSPVAPVSLAIEPPSLGATITIEGQVQLNSGATWVGGGNAGYVSANVIFRRV